MRARIPLALAGVLLAGVALRLALLLSYTPALLAYPDTWGYVKAAAGPLFMDDWIRPAGYPAFLAALHAVSGSLTFAIVAQQLLGLMTAVLAYLATRRLGCPRWVAIVPAAVLALSLDVLYFEHTLLSETLFTFLVTAALYAAARGLEAASARPEAWFALSGLLLGLATTVRVIALFLVPFFALVFLLFHRAGLRRRLAGAAAACAVALAVVLGYAALQSTQNGYFGITEGGGWTVYTRAAPFADCRVFTPPPGTEELCETSDARTRPGPDFYAWNPGSPARRLFDGPPHGADEVGAFGRAAIRAQPKAYLSDVARDLWRFVDPDAGARPADPGDGPEELMVDRRHGAREELNLTVVEPYYGDVGIEVDPVARRMADVQHVLRVQPAMVPIALLLVLIALPLARRRDRLALLLLAGTAVVPVVIATATTVYGWRYFVPFSPMLMAAGALGAWVIWERLRGQRPRSEESTRQTSLASPERPGIATTRSRTQSTA